jgi:signal transduction histidine kinase
MPTQHSPAVVLLESALGVPLRIKLAGANILIALTAAAILLAPVTSSRIMAGVVILAIVLSVTVNVALVSVALRPLRALEDTATRVWHGDLGARVPESAFADPEMRRAGGTINLLLDSLTADRTRARLLAIEVIRARDKECARISHELHDSAAQRLAALTYELSAAAQDSVDPLLSQRLDSIRTNALDVMEEVKALSHVMHPRVLEDLGLTPALEQLLRQVQQEQGISVHLKTTTASVGIPVEITSVLYRVAQEALHNAVHHGKPTSIEVTLDVDDVAVSLCIRDDGQGYDDQTTAVNPGVGLFSMRERIALVNGTFNVKSALRQGTLVSVTIPLRT